MTYYEDDLLPISALQHLAYCERQWALIHLEGAWQENRLTAEGSVMHENAYEEETETRGDLRIARGLRLRSLRLGLVGMADVVEFERVSAEKPGVTLDGIPGKWQPFIVEYKRGHPKNGHEDEVQLCAQAMCLEEMLGIPIPRSTFFYGQPRRRSETELTSELREETEKLAARLHELTELARTPQAEYNARCRACSLLDICLPKTTDGHTSAQSYLKRMLTEAETLP